MAKRRHVSAPKAREPEGLLTSFQQTLAPLFDEFRAAGDDAARGRIALRLCEHVAAQCDVEEEFLYPEAARASARPDNRVRAAQLEGLFVRKVVNQIRTLATAPRLDTRRLAATVEVLHGYLADYVDQQRVDVLPRLRRHGARASGVYTAMLNRRAEILAAR